MLSAMLHRQWHARHTFAPAIIFSASPTITLSRCPYGWTSNGMSHGNGPRNAPWRLQAFRRQTGQESVATVFQVSSALAATPASLPPLHSEPFPRKDNHAMT
eukprot:1207487-Amphidinium_carterae.1